ncbi:MAG TPA: hypothetical protein VG649_08070 [Candidatus Angelobacter sp.]|nr:hypothetical protein [Candidatus Angelobacter sp.]
MIPLYPFQTKPYPYDLAVFSAVHREEEIIESVTQFVFVAALLLTTVVARDGGSPMPLCPPTQSCESTIADRDGGPPPLLSSDFQL